MAKQKIDNNLINIYTKTRDIMGVEYKQLNIGYYCSTQIGDTILSLKMLYSIKHIYNAKIIIFIENHNLKNLLNLNFIDQIQLINKNNIIQKINNHKLDYLISYISTYSTIQLLEQTNAKKIIIKAKFKSILSMKCKVVFFNILKRIYNNKNIEDLMLYYARKIQPKIFDKKIKNLYFDISIQTTQKNKNLINKFLYNNRINNFIIINPFSISTKFNLNIFLYFDLIQKILNTKNISIVIPTYNRVYKYFIEKITEFDSKLLTKIFIFQNNNDILNLVELISKSKCVISPSTGVIHIASNLKISSIGLYSKKDSIYWSTYNKDYVFIDAIHNKFSRNDADKIISDVINKLQKYIS